ncbi:TonB C-terminal domain-containing protein [uncultured Campylobacter sp.]|uniref:TonB C-terminal domain-containing protein n=1 Tax=uncultured Campylobacter sp. TaxID=218934 RepID=UPI002602F498|nr:TonB C-terminal domain-containing protein [uncultured Campylobacter sp.]
MKSIRFFEIPAFFISLFLTFLIVLSIGYCVKEIGKVLQNVQYTDDKNAYITIYSDEDDDTNSKTKGKEQTKKSRGEKTEKKITSRKASSKSNNNQKAQSFATEVTKNEPEDEEINLNKLYKDALQSNRQSDKENVQKGDNIDDESSDIGDNIPDDKKGKTQRTGVYNKFIGGVNGKLTRLWERSGVSGKDFALVEIMIDQNGNLKVTVIEPSYNRYFNQKFRAYIEIIENQKFPIPPYKEFIGTNGLYIHKYRFEGGGKITMEN